MPRALWELGSIENANIVSAVSDVVNKELEKALRTYSEEGEFFISRRYENYRITYHFDDEFDFKSTIFLKDVLIQCAEADDIFGHAEDGIAKKLFDMYVEWEKSYSGEKDPKGKAND